MIVYIVSFALKNELQQAITESGQAVLDGQCIEQFDLLEYIKKQANQYRLIDKLLIDIDALKNSEKEILEALSSFRLLFDEAQVVVIASGRQVGDRLLSEVFELGIYDIITSFGNELTTEISCVLEKRMQYRDSLKFKVKLDEIAKQGTTVIKVKEKVVTKQKIITKVIGMTICFVGSQERIGTTHLSIMAAKFLVENGFKVALCECNGKTAFADIKEGYEDVQIQGEERFSLSGIDFFSIPVLEERQQAILREGYNFIVIDYGILNSKNIEFFLHGGKQIYICGSKPWELKEVNKIFEYEMPLDTVDFLFNFTDPIQRSEIKENMEGMKTYFTEFYPDLFLKIKGDCIFRKIFQEFIPESIEEIRKNVRGSELKDVFTKLLKGRRRTKAST